MAGAELGDSDILTYGGETSGAKSKIVNNIAFYEVVAVRRHVSPFCFVAVDQGQCLPGQNYSWIFATRFVSSCKSLRIPDTGIKYQIYV